MHIDRVERWLVMGKEFDSVAKAEQSIYDAIGERLSRAMNNAGLGPGQQIKLMDSIWADRAALAELLSFTKDSEHA